MEDLGIFCSFTYNWLFMQKKSSLNLFGKVFDIIAGMLFDQLSLVLTPVSFISILEIPTLGGPKDPEKIGSYYCI